jgi:hypothetical protein
LVQTTPQGVEARLPFRVILADGHQHADAPHPLWLLRTRPQRPCCCHATEKRNQLSPLHASAPEFEA